jgi:tetratricopeptide (TPR) repeat protein
MDGSLGESRFTMLETVHEYALDRLAAGGEAEALQRAHAAYYLGLAEVGAPVHMGERRSLAWLGRLEAEHDNLRAALSRRVVAPDGAQDGLRLANVLTLFWSTRGYVQECRDWTERALAHPGASHHPREQAHALANLGATYWVGGDNAAGEASVLASLRLSEALGDRPACSRAISQLGGMARERGDTALARQRLEASIALYRELRDRSGLAGALVTLGQVAVMLEDAGWATRLLEEGLALSRETGDVESTGWALNHLGHVAQLRGEWERARQMQDEALATFAAISARYFGIVHVRQSLGELALAQDQAAAATPHLRQALILSRDEGYQPFVSWGLAGLAGVAALDEEPKRAARLWSAAEAHRQALGVRDAPASRATRERLMAAVKEQLGEAAFAAAWAEGARLTLEQAVELALADQ